MLIAIKLPVDISYKSVESYQYYFMNGFFGSCWCLNLLIPHKTVAYLYASLEFPDPMVSLTDAVISLLVTQWCFLIYFVVSVTDAMMHMLSLLCDRIKTLYLTPLKAIEDVAAKVALK
jgi:hypothetical protein